MKTQRTPDGITWEGLPNLFRELVPPQSAGRLGDSIETLPVRAPAAFWRKLVQSLRDPAIRAAWRPSLGQKIENVGEGRLNSKANDSDLESFIAEAATGFGDLLRESMQQPLLLVDAIGAQITFARLLLTNGATAILRVDSHQAVLQDCFFTRSARECPTDLTNSQSRRQAVVREMTLRHTCFQTSASGLVPSTHAGQNRVTTLARDAAAWGVVSTTDSMRWGEFAAPEANSSDEPFSPPDAAACLPELDAAIRHVDAVDRTARAYPPGNDSALRLAAYRLAAALGYCRLFGVRPAGSAAELTLPARLLPLVVRESTDRLARWSANAPTTGDAQPSLWVEEDYWSGLFESRMEAWAVFVEIDRATGPSFIATDGAAPIDPAAIDDLLAATDSFDAVLQSHEHELAAAPRLLANYRTLLAPRYLECTPWWLCESLSPLAM